MTTPPNRSEITEWASQSLSAGRLETLRAAKDAAFWSVLTESACQFEGTLIFDLVDRYPALLDWKVITRSGRYFLNENAISQFESYVDFPTLSRSAFAWSKGLLSRYSSRLDWDSLSSNPFNHWTLEILSSFEDRWNWKLLSANPSLPWTGDLIERYCDRWDWGSCVVHDDGRGYQEKHYSGLSSNLGLPFDQSLLHRFAGRWMQEGLDANPKASEAKAFFQSKPN